MNVKSALLILALFLTAFFISGCEKSMNVIVCNKPYILVGGSCCLDSNNNNICDKDETQKPVEQPPTTTPSPPTPVEAQNEFKMVKGDVVTFAGKNITLFDYSVFGGELETTVDVDGKTWDIYNTNKPEIFSGLKITPISVDRLQNFVTIKFEPFALGTNQYLIKQGINNVILGKIVKLRNVQQEDDGIVIAVGDIDSFIQEGNTNVVAGLKITNVEGFYRPSQPERYAIVTIVSA